jgi:hypothetical protein
MPDTPQPGFTEAFPWGSAPEFLIRDNDKLFGEVFQRRVRAMGIRDHPITARSLWQNGYVERVIGSIRRECLGHTIVLGEAHLQRTLDAYANYYNNGEDPPCNRQECSGSQAGQVFWTDPCLANSGRTTPSICRDGINGRDSNRVACETPTLQTCRSFTAWRLLFAGGVTFEFLATN